MEESFSSKPEERRSIAQRASSAVRQTIDAVGEKIEHGTMAGAVLNTLCNCIGAGVLSMAFAMHNASLGIGIMLVFYSAFCSAIASYAMAKGCEDTELYTMPTMVGYVLFTPQSRAEFRKAKRDADGTRGSVVNSHDPTDDELYEEYEANEMKKAKRRDVIEVFINIMTFFYNFGSLIIYGRIIADSIPPVIASFLHGSGFWVQRYTWLSLGGVIFFVLSCARHMEELKWASLLGFLTILYMIMMVWVRYFTNEQHPIDPRSDPGVRDVQWWHITIATFSAITTYGQGFCYHYNVPYFYKELKDHSPKRFMISVAICLPITVFSYLVVGITGYMTFGALVADKAAGGNIVNNYRDDDIAINIGRLGLFLHFVSVYPLRAVSCRRNFHRMLFRFYFDKRGRSEQLGLLTEEQENNRAAKNEAGGGSNDDPAENPTRPQIIAEAAFLVSVCAVIAYFVPGVGVVIQVTGCLFGMFLMFLAPAVVGVCIFSKKFVPKSIKESGEENSAHFADPSRRRNWYLSLFLLISGLFFYIAGIISLATGFVSSE